MVTATGGGGGGRVNFTKICKQNIRSSGEQSKLQTLEVEERESFIVKGDNNR